MGVELPKNFLEFEDVRKEGFGTADEISPMDCFAARLLSQSITAIRISGCCPACSYLLSCQMPERPLV